MTKIIINTTLFYNFDLTAEAIEKYLERKGKECYFYRLDAETNKLYYLPKPKTEIKEYYNCLEDVIYLLPFTENIGDITYFVGGLEDKIFNIHHIPRDDSDLVYVIETLGERSYPLRTGTRLEVIEVPDDVKWRVVESHGYEYIRELSRESHGSPTEEDNYYNSLKDE